MTTAAGAQIHVAIGMKGSPVAAGVLAASKGSGAKGLHVVGAELQGNASFTAGPASFGLKLQALLQTAVEPQDDAAAESVAAMGESANTAGEPLKTGEGILNEAPIRPASASVPTPTAAPRATREGAKSRLAAANSDFATKVDATTPKRAEERQQGSAISSAIPESVPANPQHSPVLTSPATNPVPNPQAFQPQGSYLPTATLDGAALAPVAVPVAVTPAQHDSTSAAQGAGHTLAAEAQVKSLAMNPQAVFAPAKGSTLREPTSMVAAAAQSGFDSGERNKGSVAGPASEPAHSETHPTGALKDARSAAPVRTSALHQAGEASDAVTRRNFLTAQDNRLSPIDATAEAGVLRQEGAPDASEAQTASRDLTHKSGHAAHTVPPAAAAIGQEAKPGAVLRSSQSSKTDRIPTASEPATMQLGAPRAATAEAPAKAGVKQSTTLTDPARRVQSVAHAAPINSDAQTRVAQAPAQVALRSADASRSVAAVSGGSNEVFAALDTPVAPAANWVHADTRHAEAGYLDPSLGWVAVRAETAGAAVHASIVPATADAAQVLGSHLPALSAYMAEHPTAATQISMAAPEMAAGGQGSPMARGDGQGQSSRNPNADALDASGPALRGRTQEHSAPAQAAGPIGFRSGATISLVA